jgi:hypothetical protein
MSNLSPNERDLLVHLFWEGRSQRDIACASGVSAVTIHKRTKSCLERLRQHLSRHGVRVSVAGLLVCLGGLAGSPPGTCSWVLARNSATGFSAAAIAIAIGVATSAAIAALTFVLAGSGSRLQATSTEPAGRPGRMDTSQSPSPEQVPQAVAAHPQSPPFAVRSLPATCSSSASSTGWSEIDPATWGVLSQDRRRIVALSAYRVPGKSGGGGLKVTVDGNSDGKGYVILAIPAPASFVLGFQLRLTYRLANTPSVAGPRTVVHTEIRSLRPSSDVLLETTFFEGVPIDRNESLADMSHTAFVFHIDRLKDGRSLTTRQNWHASMYGQCPWFSDHWLFMTSGGVELLGVEGRALSRSEREALLSCLDSSAESHCVKPEVQEGRPEPW